MPFLSVSPKGHSKLSPKACERVKNQCPFPSVQIDSVYCFQPTCALFVLSKRCHVLPFLWSFTVIQTPECCHAPRTSNTVRHKFEGQWWNHGAQASRGALGISLHLPPALRLFCVQSCSCCSSTSGPMQFKGCGCILWLRVTQTCWQSASSESNLFFLCFVLNTVMSNLLFSDIQIWLRCLRTDKANHNCTCYSHILSITTCCHGPWCGFAVFSKISCAASQILTKL